MADMTTHDDTAATGNGYVSARYGKWHRATVAEPACYRSEATGCGLTIRPLNVTWHGERLPTMPANMCRRPGCRDTGEG